MHIMIKEILFQHLLLWGLICMKLLGVICIYHKLIFLDFATTITICNLKKMSRIRHVRGFGVEMKIALVICAIMESFLLLLMVEIFHYHRTRKFSLMLCEKNCVHYSYLAMRSCQIMLNLLLQKFYIIQTMGKF